MDISYTHFAVYTNCNKPIAQQIGVTVNYSSTKKTNQIISPIKTINMNPKTITPSTPIIEMVS